MLNFLKNFSFTRFIFTGIVPEKDLPKNDQSPDRLGLNKKSPIGMKVKYLFIPIILVSAGFFVSKFSGFVITVLSRIAIFVAPNGELAILLKAEAAKQLIEISLYGILTIMLFYYAYRTIKSIKFKTE